MALVYSCRRPPFQTGEDGVIWQRRSSAALTSFSFTGLPCRRSYMALRRKSWSAISGQSVADRQSFRGIAVGLVPCSYLSRNMWEREKASRASQRQRLSADARMGSGAGPGIEPGSASPSRNRIALSNCIAVGGYSVRGPLLSDECRYTSLH